MNVSCGRLRSLACKGVTTMSVGVALCASLATVPPAGADELDDLIASTEEISQQANSKNEEVKALEAEVADKEETVAALRRDADAARDEAAQAFAAQTTFRDEINRISGARYRGVTLDPITSAMGATDPQNAIDRMAYLTALTRRTENVFTQLDTSTRLAATRLNTASLAATKASNEQQRLQEALDKLRAEQDELSARQADVQARVDALTEEAREVWVNHNNPISVAVDFISNSAVVNAAMSKQGAPYSWGAAGPNEFDCSGLVYWAHQQAGKAIPRTSQAQVAGGTPVSKSELQPGDVVGFYSGVTHVGLYIGNGQVVHASDYGIPVQVVSLDSMPFAGAARY